MRSSPDPIRMLALVTLPMVLAACLGEQTPDGGAEDDATTTAALDSGTYTVSLETDSGPQTVTLAYSEGPAGLNCTLPGRNDGVYKLVGRSSASLENPHPGTKTARYSRVDYGPDPYAIPRQFHVRELPGKRPDGTHYPEILATDDGRIDRVDLRPTADCVKEDEDANCRIFKFDGQDWEPWSAPFPCDADSFRVQTADTVRSEASPLTVDTAVTDSAGPAPIRIPPGRFALGTD